MHTVEERQRNTVTCVRKYFRLEKNPLSANSKRNVMKDKMSVSQRPRENILGEIKNWVKKDETHRITLTMITRWSCSACNSVATETSVH